MTTTSTISRPKYLRELSTALKVECAAFTYAAGDTVLIPLAPFNELVSATYVRRTDRGHETFYMAKMADGSKPRKIKMFTVHVVPMLPEWA